MRSVVGPPESRTPEGPSLLRRQLSDLLLEAVRARERARRLPVGRGLHAYCPLYLHRQQVRQHTRVREIPDVRMRTQQR